MDFLGENGLSRLWEHVTSKLATKVNKVNGMGLSSNDYSNEDKDKLSNIEEGAQVNTVTSVNGQIGDVVIGDSSGFNSHVSDKTNPHDVTLAQLGVTATVDEVNYINGVTSNIQTQLNSKVSTSLTINDKPLTGNITLTVSDLGMNDSESTDATLNLAKAYTDDKVLEVNNSINNIINGNTIVANATNAEKATSDSNGNVFGVVYETKSDATSKLDEAKSYADAKIGFLLNNSTEAVDSIYELRDAMEENADAIDALTEISGSKANSVHTHTISDVTNLQSTLDNKASISHTHSIANITNLQTTLNNKASTSIATSSTNGLMSYSDKTKLDEIDGENVYVQNNEPTNASDGDLWVDLDAEGTKVENGFTPIKGVDYWTELDKAEMIQDVLSALPTWTGGRY